MMKLRIPTRNLLNPTNRNRTISSNTLHIGHYNSILFSCTYLPRCKLRLNHPIPPCQWSFHILYLPIHTRRTRNLLWIICLHRNMKCRLPSSVKPTTHSGSVPLLTLDPLNLGVSIVKLYLAPGSSGP
uniref:Uncharacterized protein n=1 Tax=Castor canadensis TaxID=51338 RepID=A0A8C0W1N6_CASCN